MTILTQQAEAAAAARKEFISKEAANCEELGQTLLYTKNVGVHYGKKEALSGVNLEFEKGQVTALIGPSGCGKSTFLRCLNLMNREIYGCTIDGEIYFNGQQINDKATDVYELRQAIGMVFQQPNPFRKTIYDNIAFALRQHGIKDKKTIEKCVVSALYQAALYDEVKDSLHTKGGFSLSGGQQQRLCIARTLALKPQIVLMDEPCSALDPIATLAIEATIGEIARQGISVIIVTHNIEQARRVSDKTAFFLLGEVIEWGDTQQVFEDPHDERTKDYLMGRFG